MLKMSFYDLLANQDYCNSFEYLARNTSLEDTAANENGGKNDDFVEFPIDHYHQGGIVNKMLNRTYQNKEIN